MQCSGAASCIQLWHAWTVDTILKFGHITFAATAAQTLPGSCIDAGYTTCCEGSPSNCPGQPPSCFCDSSCHEFSDCCQDIDQLCPGVCDGGWVGMCVWVELLTLITYVFSFQPSHHRQSPSSSPQLASPSTPPPYSGSALTPPLTGHTRTW